MKYFVMLSFLLFPASILAQQVNTYDVCTRSQEVYTPGGYDRYGNYFPGRVSVQTYQIPCNSGNQYYSNNSGGCRPGPTILGALLGGGVAASMSRGDGYAWSVPVGAAIGGALFGCN